MNTKVLISAVSFVIGAALGSVVTLKLVKDKYAQKANEEIADVKEFYANKDKYMTDIVKEDQSELEVENKSDDQSGKTRVEDLAQKVSELKYNIDDYIVYEDSVQPKYSKPLPESEQYRPYVIPPDELGECSYEIQNMTYYADEVLASEFDEVVYDIDGTVGEENLMHFGDYEEDIVCVRNPELQIDFEIWRDSRTFALVVDDGGK